MWTDQISLQNQTIPKHWEDLSSRWKDASSTSLSRVQKINYTKIMAGLWLWLCANAYIWACSPTMLSGRLGHKILLFSQGIKHLNYQMCFQSGKNAVGERPQVEGYLYSSFSFLLAPLYITHCTVILHLILQPSTWRWICMRENTYAIA